MFIPTCDHHKVNQPEKHLLHQFYWRQQHLTNAEMCTPQSLLGRPSNAVVLADLITINRDVFTSPGTEMDHDEDLACRIDSLQDTISQLVQCVASLGALCGEPSCVQETTRDLISVGVEPDHASPSRNHGNNGYQRAEVDTGSRQGSCLKFDRHNRTARARTFRLGARCMPSTLT